MAADNTRLTIAGRVEGNAKPGIRVYAGPPYYALCTDPYAGASVNFCRLGSYYLVAPWAGASIRVAEGATVSGLSALTVSRDPRAASYVSVDLTNAGTMTGTAGPAILASQSVSQNVSATDAATGTIGGIRGGVATIVNDGVISGVGGVAI
ncbi:hypothetical protein [Sphingomonas sp. BK580]|uniref:hypothetical protein n=1 Tax=Sphingomonas sp. BK580 TaxID=2586972 RepID=UPI001614B6B7|nr:hypothetical protein [Sphingomonas sp. BK580]MBB3693765.1 hypothetical protein [Sphingomonas sp. BK580]